MFRKLTTLAAAMVFTVGAGAALADDNGNELVLTAVIEGLANPQFTDDPCILTNTEFGTGLDLNIGKITFETMETVDLSSSMDCMSPDRAEVDSKLEMDPELWTVL